MNQRVPAAPVAVPAFNRAKVFVSYSRKDLAFAQMLVGALAERGFDAFLDKTDIAPGEPWKERLARLIATADTVVFTISPDSISSAICAWELEESARLGKRVIPVVARRIADADAPPALGRLNWVFFAESDDKDAALATLNTALHTDLPWVREHTRIGELARRWDEQGRGNGATLRGADLETAERWLDRRPADANAPTDLHQDFIRASRRAATARQRYWVGGSLAVAFVAIALAAFAEINRREAQAQRDRAERTLTIATDTANSLVFDLAQKFRNVVGVPASTIKDILDRARQLQGQLLGAGESTPGLRRSQAEASMETANTLLTLGETQSSLTAAKQAQETFQALLAQQPSSTDFQNELSTSGRVVGDVLRAQGNLPEALTSYQASLAIADRLAKSDPGNAVWQRDLSVSYERIGDVQVAQGNLSEAMKSHQASLTIADRLATADPGNAGWQRDLAVSYDKVGDVQVDQGNLAAALTSYQASLAMRDRLAKSDPGNAGGQRDLSASYIKVGGAQVAQGNLAAALTSYQASFAIFDRLAKSDPGNAGWQSDLAVSYEKVGDVQVEQGNLPEALKSYQASLAIGDRLTKTDPGNTNWQAALGISNELVGDVLVAQGNLAQALKSFQAKCPSGGFLIL
jgi:tetratricopeptide (TPR) repeat protein